MANLSNSLGRVQSVPKTAAYRTTFGNTGLQASMGDVLRAVEDQAARCLTAFAKQHVFTEIVTDIGMGRITLPGAFENRKCNDTQMLLCLIAQAILA